MRTFTLVNGDMQACNLTDVNVFFHDPAGLGMDFSDKYRQVGNRFVRVTRKSKQRTISGSVAFLGADPYLSYFNFALFAQKDPLVLLYCPNDQAPATSPSGTTYRMNVDVAKIEKTELEQEGYLDCQITLVSKTPWYKYSAISNGIVHEDDLLKWGIQWGIDWGPLDEYHAGIKSTSPTPSPSKLTIYGPITNPFWTHYVNGNETEYGKVNAVIKDSEYLVVDSTVDPYVIQKRSTIDDSLIANLYEASDFTTKRFVTIQNGGNVIKVVGDNASDPLVKLEAHIYYESV